MNASPIIEKFSTDDNLQANCRTFEILEGYNKISDIIKRTNIAMGKNQVVKLTAASCGSDKIIAYATPSTY